MTAEGPPDWATMAAPVGRSGMDAGSRRFDWAGHRNDVHDALTDRADYDPIMARRSTTAAGTAAILGALALLIGCTSKAPVAEVRFSGEEYAQVFQDAKDVLRRAQFELDRVDARAGVITTRPKPSAGLATPWIRQSSGLKGSISGFLHRERRVARIRFEPIEASSETTIGETDPLLDLRAYEGEVEATIEVEIQRVEPSEQRFSPQSIRLQSYVIDATPGSESASAGPGYVSRPDEALSERLTRTLGRRAQTRVSH